MEEKEHYWVWVGETNDMTALKALMYYLENQFGEKSLDALKGKRAHFRTAPSQSWNGALEIQMRSDYTGAGGIISAHICAFLKGHEYARYPHHMG